ncbi:MAG: hypothetical protein ACOVLE_14155 [Pirellula staleyi]
MVKKTEAAEATKPDEETAEGKVKRYEGLFDELMRFTSLIDEQDAEIVEANAVVAEAKEAYERAKKALAEIESIRDGAKHNLYRFLSPKNGKFEFLPLFDRMEETNELVHGENSTEWRQEPIASLKLSLLSLVALNDSDITLVGKLQDLVMKDSNGWYKEITGLNAGSSAAIVDRLNEFIFQRTMKK